VSYTIGALLALAVGVVTARFGLARDRALYPAAMIVIALYYVLFAVMGGSAQIVMIESLIAVVFVVLALASFKITLWLVVAALAAHGIFDFAHPHVYVNAGVPAWWPPFCFAYDVMAAAYLAWLLVSKQVAARAA
jgi:hypothetical protein